MHSRRGFVGHIFITDQIVVGVTVSVLAYDMILEIFVDEMAL